MSESRRLLRGPVDPLPQFFHEGTCRRLGTGDRNVATDVENWRIAVGFGQHQEPQRVEAPVFAARSGSGPCRHQEKKAGAEQESLEPN